MNGNDELIRHLLKAQLGFKYFDCYKIKLMILECKIRRCGMARYSENVCEHMVVVVLPTYCLCIICVLEFVC